MCGILESDIKIAKKDIVVYKILYRDAVGYWPHVFRNDKYEIGKKAPKQTITTHKALGKTYVTVGYHSIDKLSEARRFLTYTRAHPDGEMVVAKCTIPKGSGYVEIETKYGHPDPYVGKGYVSTNIIINDIYEK